MHVGYCSSGSGRVAGKRRGSCVSVNGSIAGRKSDPGGGRALLPSTAEEMGRDQVVSEKCRAGISSNTWCACGAAEVFGSRSGFCRWNSGIARWLPMVSEECPVRHFIEHLACMFLGTGSDGAGGAGAGFRGSGLVDPAWWAGVWVVIVLGSGFDPISFLINLI